MQCIGLSRVAEFKSSRHYRDSLLVRVSLGELLVSGRTTESAAASDGLQVTARTVAGRCSFSSPDALNSSVPRICAIESSLRGTLTFPSKSPSYEGVTKASSASSQAAQLRHPCHTPDRCTASRHARC